MPAVALRTLDNFGLALQDSSEDRGPKDPEGPREGSMPYDRVVDC